MFTNKTSLSLLLFFSLISLNTLQAQLLEDELFSSTHKYLQVSMALVEDKLGGTDVSDADQMNNDIRSFYGSRNSMPAWIKIDGTLKPMAFQVPEYVSGMMHPSYFDDVKLASLFYKYNQSIKVGRKPSSRLLGKLDLMLTKTYFKLAKVNLNGYVMAEEIERIEWYLPSRNANMINSLHKALMERNITNQLNALLPQDKAYVQLKESLKKYKNIETDGGWPVVPEGILEIEIGDTSEVVVVLRQRLSVTNDLAGEYLEGEVYDENLVDAVTFYQKRNGLATDGKVGKNTLDNLNISVEERIRQLELNIERFKWLPNCKGRKYIWVNIPEYMLRVYEDGELIHENVVVAGAKRHQTPCFQSKLTNMVFNPYWNVPVSIAKNEIGPKVSQNAQYLLDKNYEVINGWGSNKVMDSTGNIDWSDKSAYTKIRFRQKPGPGNALGVVKFNMPNKWSIYLHDTPSKSKFKYAHRAYSHGCIRLSEPEQLASTVLGNDPRWSDEKVSKVIKSRKTEKVQVMEDIDVFLVYMTAWVDASGQLQLREDVYGRDKKIDAVLQNI